MSPALPLHAIQNLDFPLPEMLNGRIGFIHDLFLCFPYEICEQLPDGTGDLVVLAAKGDRHESLHQLAEYPGRVLLVLAPGDASFRPSYMPGRRGLPPNMIAAFVTNNEHSDRRAINVPLGVRSNKLRALQFVRQNHKGGREGLLYGNFTVNDEHYRADEREDRHIRRKLAERFADVPWATVDVSDTQRDTPESLVAYYSEIASHRFVLSPEGNGIDCYRTWESLYLGAIPIVMASPAMTAFADLPILFTEDYSEISEDFLERRWEEMSRRRFDVGRLLKSYYRSEFLRCVAQLDAPRFICWGFGGTPNEKFHQILKRSSRSPADVVVETPTQPFVPAGLDLMDPSSWTAAGDAEISESGDTICLTVPSREQIAATFPLRTIAGGPFRLTGYISAKASEAPPLSLSARDKTRVLARSEVQAGSEHEIAFDFVAATDRTSLVIEASSSAWLLRDLRVHATV